MIEIIPNWHPIFVHFSVALLSVSFVLFLLGRLANCGQATLVAKWNLWIGAGLSVMTVAAGFYAYNTVAHDTPSHVAMTEHKNIALLTIALLIPLVIWSVLIHRQNKATGYGFIGLFFLVSASLMATAWHGEELVYRYGLGVMSLPKTDSHDHGGHDHGEGQAAHGDDAGHHDDPFADHDDLDFGGMDDFEMDSHDNHDGHDHQH